MKKTYVLVVMDGFGLSSKTVGNAVKQAKTPNYDFLKNKYPFTTLKASGTDVGLLAGQMGNSEVGHLNLGAGRIVLQDSRNITKSIENGRFYSDKGLKSALDPKKRVHLMGLLSDGAIHSHISHIYALINMAKNQGVKELYLHLFTDGRDSEVKASIDYATQLEKYMKKIGIGEIASVTGRYFAMDREGNYNRTKKTYDALCCGKSQNTARSIFDALVRSHHKGITDEFVEPTVIMRGDSPVATIEDNDNVVFFNFRGDRARQLTAAFSDNKFDRFEAKNFKNLNFTCLTEYDKSLTGAKVIFKRKIMKNTLGAVLAKNKKVQLRVAETTKYAHVTYFFNGGVEEANDGEHRILIPTKKVKTFDLNPSMSAMEIVDIIKNEVPTYEYDFILINFANCDMVGHTGNIKATIKAVETVDTALGQIYKYFNEVGGCVLVTADHGNAEGMLTIEGKIQTAHTLNSVPFILADDEYIGTELIKTGKLANVSATILDLMGITLPREFKEYSLINKE
jgi:2,3-bisphosphoglycerate-independent phosphoglycerate mutase